MNKGRKVIKKLVLLTMFCFMASFFMVACNKSDGADEGNSKKKESKEKKKGRFITASEKGMVEYERVSDDEIVIILNNGDAVTIEMDVYDGYDCDYSQDGSVACFVNEEGQFYIVKDGAVIEDELAPPEDDPVVISAYGDTVAYFTDIEYDSYIGAYVGKLNLYDTKQRKVKIISEEAIAEFIELSPNGKTVAYIGPDKEGEYLYAGYCSVDGEEPFEIGKEAYCLAIADDAKYIYYGYENKDGLYVKKEDEDEELLLTDYVDDYIYFNQDVSEVVFCNYDDVYISVNGAEGKRLGNDGIRNFVYSNGAVWGYGEEDEVYTGISSFAGSVICTNERELYYVDSKYQMVKICSDAVYYYMSEDGRKLVYSDYYGELYKVEVSEPENATLLCENYDIEYLCVAGNLDNIYFITDYEDLYYIGEEGPELVAEGVTDVEVSSDKEHCYYVVDESEAFVFTGKGEAKSIYTSVNDCEMWKSGDIIFVGDEGRDEYILHRVEGDSVKELGAFE